MIGIIIGLILLAGFAFLVYASAGIRSGVYVKTYSRKKTTERVVALTFDDGPDPVQTPKVLDVLKRHNAKATFFCIGQKVRMHPDIARRIFDEGHNIGHHTYSHRWNFPLMNLGHTIKEISLAEVAISHATGKIPLIFRPPFGVTNPHIGRAARELSYMIIGWNIRSLDTRYYNRPDKVLRRIKRRLKPGSVILLHDRLPGSDRLSEDVLRLLHDEQYETRRIEELFDIRPYYKC